MTPRGKFRVEARRKGYSVPFIKKYRKYAFDLKQKKRLAKSGSPFRPAFRPQTKREVVRIRRPGRMLKQVLTRIPSSGETRRMWLVKKQRALRQTPTQRLAQVLYQKFQRRTYSQGSRLSQRVRSGGVGAFTEAFACSVTALKKVRANSLTGSGLYERRRLRVTQRPCLSHPARLKHLADLST